MLAGVLDICAAFAFSALRGVGPVRVLKFVASGLLGAAAVYWAASRKIALGTHPVLSGLLYGIAVYSS